MQVLKLKIYLNTAVFRQHFCLSVVNTYPLPSMSSVLGMIHSALGVKQGGTFKENGDIIEGLNLAILGQTEGFGMDYQWYHKFREKETTKMPVRVNFLKDTYLTIYIYHKDLNFLKKLLQKIEDPSYFIYLGRSEDIIELLDISIISLKQKVYPNDLSMPCYMSQADYNNFFIVGEAFLLPSYYRKKTIKVDSPTSEWVIRDFLWHRIYYIQQQELCPAQDKKQVKGWVDCKENLPVFWLINS